MSLEGEIVLQDGRKLAYMEFGRPDGLPVFYFHGTPAARVEPILIGDDRFSSLGLRIISPDRPGMGGSSFQRERRYLDWPADVIALADALGLDRFSVLGFGGGAPYAAACAVKVPERLRAVVVVSGVWRMDWPEALEGAARPFRVMTYLARRCPILLYPTLGMMGPMAGGDLDHIGGELKKIVPPVEHAAMADPSRLEGYRKILYETVVQGVRGSAWDLRLLVRDFGFALDEVRVPITLFHGELDTVALIAMARRAAGALPSAQLITFEDQGHFSTLCNKLEEIARALNAHSI